MQHFVVMAHNTRSQGTKSRVESESLSEGELDTVRKQIIEKERRLKEQAEALMFQREELDKEREDFERSKITNIDADNLNIVLNSIQRDLSALKSLPEQFLNLEHRFHDFQDKPYILENARTNQEEQLTSFQDTPTVQHQVNLDQTLISMTEPPKGSFQAPAQNIPEFQPNTTNPFQPAGINYSNSSIRDALELVPKYDGHNIPVLQFARSCKRAKELVPLTNENHLVRLLRSKLVGHAYLAVEDEIHNTVDQLIDSLKRTFGPARTSNYYRGQLSINFKKPSEHILDYICRVKDLRNAIIEGDQMQFGRLLNNLEIEQIDSYTLESFFEGLPPEYRAEIRMETCRNLQETYNRAILINKRLERDRIRQHDNKAGPVRANLPSNQQKQTPRFNIIQPNRSPLHINAPVNRTSQPTDPSFQSKICAYCKKFGHLISECRKRQYNKDRKSVV